MLHEVTLGQEDEEEDTITWNLTANGECTSASAYVAQFFDDASTLMNKMVRKMWGPPKIKFFAWLAI
jgi:hypothetical protein